MFLSFLHRSGSHDVVTSKQQSSPSPPQPPSPSRCVSGKRLCSGCSQPLGKGAAMIIDTLGLFFHIQCFKCGVCHGQLGDATAGTDVRIRNGLLSCHECYIASRGRGQPTTLWWPDFITGSSLAWLSVIGQNAIFEPHIWKCPGKVLETSELWNDVVYFPEMHK